MKRLVWLAALLVSIAPAASLASNVAVKVLVLTAFPAELAPWLKHVEHPRVLRVRGAYAPVWCDARAVCVTETGEGQVNAATTVAALMASTQLKLTKALVLRAGIAGGPPWGDVTLGGAYWANWVVSWDLGHHLAAVSHGQDEPRFLPLDDHQPRLGTDAFELNPTLVKLAYLATGHVTLADDAAARADRRRYPGQDGRQPDVAIGATVAGDDFWAGAAFSRVAQQIVDRYSHGEARYTTTAMEDTGDAGALARHGLLSHYLSLRTISDFDQPPAGQSAAAMLLAHQYPGGHIAIENAYTVGNALVDYALAHWAEFRAAMANDEVPAPSYPLNASAAEGH